jgi:hypothetical protein
MLFTTRNWPQLYIFTIGQHCTVFYICQETGLLRTQEVYSAVQSSTHKGAMSDPGAVKVFLGVGGCLPHPPAWGGGGWEGMQRRPRKEGRWDLMLAVGDGGCIDKTSNRPAWIGEGGWREEGLVTKLISTIPLPLPPQGNHVKQAGKGLTK